MILLTAFPRASPGTKVTRVYMGVFALTLSSQENFSKATIINSDKHTVSERAEEQEYRDSNNYWKFQSTCPIKKEK